MSVGSGNGTRVLARAFVLGIVAGFRSQLPFALMAMAARRGRFAVGDSERLAILGGNRAAFVLGASAVGELVVDKLPFVPSRLEPGPLAGRVVIGGAAGAVLAAEAHRPIGLGAAAGAAGGALGSYLGYWGRLLAGRGTGLPDAVVAVAEDAIGVAVGWAALSIGRRDEARSPGRD